MAEFHNVGYKGLYNGKTADDIFKRKKLRYREDVLDNMNEDELVANLFRINQTKQRFIKDNVQGEKEAKNVHYEVGQNVRKVIVDIGGMMPEKMPTPKRSLKELEREKNRVTVDWALKSTNVPIGVSTYKLKEYLPKELIDKLPTEEEINLYLNVEDE